MSIGNRHHLRRHMCPLCNGSGRTHEVKNFGAEPSTEDEIELRQAEEELETYRSEVTRILRLLRGNAACLERRLAAKRREFEKKHGIKFVRGFYTFKPTKRRVVTAS